MKLTTRSVLNKNKDWLSWIVQNIFNLYRFIFGSTFFFLPPDHTQLKSYWIGVKRKTIDWKPHSEICRCCSCWWLMCELYSTITKCDTFRCIDSSLIHEFTVIAFVLFFSLLSPFDPIALNLRCIQYSNRIIITFHWLNILFVSSLLLCLTTLFICDFIRYYLDAMHVFWTFGDAVLSIFNAQVAITTSIQGKSNIQKNIHTLTTIPNTLQCANTKCENAWKMWENSIGLSLNECNKLK